MLMSGVTTFASKCIPATVATREKQRMPVRIQSMLAVLMYPCTSADHECICIHASREVVGGRRRGVLFASNESVTNKVVQQVLVLQEYCAKKTAEASERGTLGWGELLKLTSTDPGNWPYVRYDLHWLPPQRVTCELALSRPLVSEDRRHFPSLMQSQQLGFILYLWCDCVWLRAVHSFMQHEASTCGNVGMSAVNWHLQGWV